MLGPEDQKTTCKIHVQLWIFWQRKGMVALRGVSLLQLKEREKVVFFFFFLKYFSRTPDTKGQNGVNSWNYAKTYL